MIIRHPRSKPDLSVRGISGPPHRSPLIFPILVIESHNAPRRTQFVVRRLSTDRNPQFGARWGGGGRRDRFFGGQRGMRMTVSVMAHRWTRLINVSDGVRKHQNAIVRNGSFPGVAATLGNCRSDESSCSEERSRRSRAAGSPPVELVVPVCLRFPRLSKHPR